MPVKDPIHRATGAHAHRYANLLEKSVDGHALWTPGSGVNVGDCGVISDGVFARLFNVYNPPTVLPRLSRPEIPSADALASDEPFNPVACRFIEPEDATSTLTAQPPGTIFTSSESLKVHYDATANVAGSAAVELRAALRFSASRETSDLAFLVPTGRMRLVTRLSYWRVAELERYLADNYDYIKRVYGDRVAGGEIVIVHGCDHASGWVNGVSHSSSSRVDGNVMAAGRGIGGSLGFSRRKTVKADGTTPWKTNGVQEETPPPRFPTPETTSLHTTVADRGEEELNNPGALFPEFHGMVQHGPAPHLWKPDNYSYCIIIKPVSLNNQGIFASWLRRLARRFKPTTPALVQAIAANVPAKEKN